MVHSSLPFLILVMGGEEKNLFYFWKWTFEPSDPRDQAWTTGWYLLMQLANLVINSKPVLFCTWRSFHSFWASFWRKCGNFFHGEEWTDLNLLKFLAHLRHLFRSVSLYKLNQKTWSWDSGFIWVTILNIYWFFVWLSVIVMIIFQNLIYCGVSLCLKYCNRKVWHF